MSKLRLRPFRRDDAKAIVNWCDSEEVFYKWTAGIMGAYPLTVQRLVEVTSERDDNDKYFPFTAVDDDGVAGFFTLRQPEDDKDELRFGFVIVNPDIRGKGYGKQMLNLGLKYAIEIYGAKKVSLGVFDNNEMAYHCYKAVGFEENGMNKEYDMCGEKWNCIEMEINN